jgi:hypothetical protein
MEDNRRSGLGRRVASAAGRGGKHAANYFGKWVLAPIAMVAAVVVALVFFAIPYLTGQMKDTFTGPKLTPKVQLNQANRRCALVAAYHDGQSKLERLGAAMAHINLANAKGMTTSQIYERFLTLVIPGEKVISVRSCTADYIGYGWTMAQKGNWSAGEIALDDCLRDESRCLEEHPWLSCVKYEIRNTWKKATPKPDYRLRTDPRVRRVYPENPGPNDAEFFCDK